jgi:hypothetical protein
MLDTWAPAVFSVKNSALRDLAVREAAGDQAEHLALAAGEPERPAGLAGRGRLGGASETRAARQECEFARQRHGAQPHGGGHEHLHALAPALPGRMTTPWRHQEQRGGVRPECRGQAEAPRRATLRSDAVVALASVGRELVPEATALLLDQRRQAIAEDAGIG